MINEPGPWHCLFRLADFPALSAAARGRTHAAKLDGRACHFLYTAAISEIDWETVSPDELAFMVSLGVAVRA